MTAVQTWTHTNVCRIFHLLFSIFVDPKVEERCLVAYHDNPVGGDTTPTYIALLEKDNLVKHCWR